MCLPCTPCISALMLWKVSQDVVSAPAAAADAFSQAAACQLLRLLLVLWCFSLTAAYTLIVDCGWHWCAARSVRGRPVQLPCLRGEHCCTMCADPDTYFSCTAGSNEEGIQELIAAARQELDGLHVDYEGTVQRKLDIARRLYQLKGAASMQVR